MQSKRPLNRDSSLAKRTVVSAILFNYGKCKGQGVSLRDINKRINTCRVYLSQTLKMRDSVKQPGPVTGVDRNPDLLA